MQSELRGQLRKLIRSERYVLYDPAGKVLQLAVMFEPWLQGMVKEAGGVVQYLLPWMTEAMAAQVALAGSSVSIQISDRIETWRRAR